VVPKDVGRMRTQLRELWHESRPLVRDAAWFMEDTDQQALQDFEDDIAWDDPFPHSLAREIGGGVSWMENVMNKTTKSRKRFSLPLVFFCVWAIFVFPTRNIASASGLTQPTTHDRGDNPLGGPGHVGRSLSSKKLG